ncbi:DUF262 domain-containing protein [Aliiroseovarius sp. S1339]|uniref:GmrSD restriction endonuclease domain-containing protein n=1 Tax=Aliiroseovarius sp. S1339 TaxID=2936990 RepID=UPI0020BEF3E2|nr:DUF262 domain-containing protein [Aliiroseovarius sp. S1339]MCK8462400.1 DUF262 domain-containing protein [Aliiroseovarius sp. S1339]
MSKTVYKKIDYDLSGLISDIKIGDIALPELQRPFVWKNAKVRNLFDSMYRGFPVGFFLFWEPSVVEGARTIGTDGKQKTPRLLVVDGQQRLTSLYAVMTGTPVIREGYDAERIEISFNPLQEKFEVADATTHNNRQFLPNISVIWDKKADFDDVKDEYFARLAEVQELSDEDRKKARSALNRLEKLSTYPFTALELTANVNEEQVSEVFVRINSEGKKLNQADFILTLMSVFWDEGRAELEKFCRDARLPSTSTASPFNYLMQPDPDQLLRVSVGVAFRRARLQYVYSILRGKDLETEEFSDERREEQFSKLKDAQSRVLNLQYWHDFLKAIRFAGYKSHKMISSQNAVLFAYILYLLGRTELKFEEPELRRLIAKWFFVTGMTGRFTSSPESKMEADLAKLREVENKEQFKTVLDQICGAITTNDYWKITLPTELATSSARSPSMFAYFASLTILDANVLFSEQKVAELLDTSTKEPRSPIERHHLFPRAYLDSIGRQTTTQKNQIANYALVEWGDNNKISDAPPADYLPDFESRFSKKDLERMYYWHALPDGWPEMIYEDFLRERREKIAAVVQDAFSRFEKGTMGQAAEDSRDIAELIAEGENGTTEFKSTLRRNMHTGDNDVRMENSVLKTIVGFLNSKGGGTLIVGVKDDGEALGIETDSFKNEDQMYLHMNNLIKDRIGAKHMLYIHPHFDEYDDKRVLVVECQPARSPVYLKDGNEERFYIRSVAATVELKGGQAQDYIAQRF